VLRWRLCGAACVIAPISVLVWLDAHYSGERPGIWLLPLALVFGLAACDELAQLFRAGSHDVGRAHMFVAAFLAMLATFVPVWLVDRPVDCPVGKWGWCVLGLVASMWWLVCVELRGFREPGHSVTRIAVSLFAVVYVVVPLGFLMQLRLAAPGSWGLVALVSIIVVVKCADSGAYFVGKLVGRHRLAPVLSPKKTWEGAVGAVLAAEVAAWVYFRHVVPWVMGSQTDVVSTPTILLYGLTLAIAGMIGDLGESLLKRDVGQKDSASWLPGLGGTLDVLDSILLAAPVAYFWWVSNALGQFDSIVP
jgi:phosphatidate cytidylyltransferase